MQSKADTDEDSYSEIVIRKTHVEYLNAEIHMYVCEYCKQISVLNFLCDFFQGRRLCTALVHFEKLKKKLEFKMKEHKVNTENYV